MNDTVHKILPAVLASYEHTGGINNLDGINLPSKRAVAAICMRLLQILFPGYHDHEPLPTAQVAAITLERLLGVSGQLNDEIHKSLLTRDPQASAEDANAVTVELLAQLPMIRELLAGDVASAYEGDPAATSYGEIILSYPCIESIAIQRVAHLLYKRNIPLLPRIMTEWAHSRSGIDIHPGASIGTHFFIDHGTGVVIGETCVIGNHVKLYHGVTLGAKSFRKDSDGNILKGGSQRHPTVEDGVTIYPNSTILGGETVIGAGSTIGGNVFLTHSVPPNTLVNYEEKQLVFITKRVRNSSDAETTTPGARDSSLQDA